MDDSYDSIIRADKLSSCSKGKYPKDLFSRAQVGKHGAAAAK